MRKVVLSAVLAVSLCAVVQAQTPSPTPPPADESDVVKITTALIQIDVMVTDRNGNVITDLRPDEVEVYENGEKQKITNFSFVSNVRRLDQAVQPRTNTILPPSRMRPEQVRRTMALVVDDLTLSFESTAFVRRALKKFVDEQMQDGDLVAIIRTGAGIGALQQFTNDRRQLHAAIERIRWNPIGNGKIGAFAPLQPTDDDSLQPEEPAAGTRTADGIQREQNDFRESLFATGTLGAVNYVVRGMQELPGRKSIMLLSEGFRLFSEDALGFRESGRVMANLEKLVDIANRASVVIYTMDARGLQWAGLTSADDPEGRSSLEIDDEMARRRRQLRDTQDGLRHLARETGGLSIINNNDLSGGIRKMLDDQSYYLIAYDPDDSIFDPATRKFNKLDIRVSRPGARVRYRSGFFAVNDAKLLTLVPVGDQRFLHALTSPFGVNDISLRLNALFYNSTRSGNVIRSLLHIQANDLRFTDAPNGVKKAVFDVIAIGFGDNGAPVEQLSKTFTVELKKDAYERAQKSGFVYDFAFPIKKPGAYQLRVAIRDQESGSVGSANQFIEVPNLKQGRLVTSGAVLENLSYEEWQKRNAGQAVANSQALIATSKRQFSRGTVLTYGFTIYNAKQPTDLSYQTSIFRDGKLVTENPARPVAGITDAGGTEFLAALALGSQMPPGDYVLQVTITDNSARSKKNTVVQFVQFELVE